jgi:hypothetical protein
MRPHALCVALCLPLLATWACGGDSSSGGASPGGPDAGAVPEASVPLDSGSPGDAGSGADADAAPPATYGDVTDSSRWTQLGLASVNVTDRAINAAVFDGRYLYLAPSYDGLSSPQSHIARYDTQASFADAASWTTFDLTTVTASAKEIAGGTFDGRYVYFAPEGKNSAGKDVVRYDTQGPFDQTASYKTFDSTGIAGAPVAFWGAAYDGARYVYLTGGQGSATQNPYFYRYDTQAAFDQAASWEQYYAGSVSTNADYGNGVVVLGKYVYFNVVHAGAGYTGVIARFDSSKSFSDASAWAKADITSIGTNFGPGVTDGKYVYFPNATGTIARHDPSQDFTMAASWTGFDGTTVDAAVKNLMRAGFDGRYMYFTPNYENQSKTLLVRFDTQGSFTTAGSWTVKDLYPFATPSNFYGAGAVGFDGRYLYVAPSRDDATSILRYDARTPASAFKGSFY